MKFSELYIGICGDNRVNWWFIENHEDKGSIPPCTDNKSISKIPSRVWNSNIVRIGAEGDKLIDIGLEEESHV